jgi:hypothetical protein
MTYLGYEVLEAEADGRLAREDSYEREIFIVGGGHGRTLLDDPQTAPELVRTYHWTCQSLADIAELKAFLDARLGRLVPFWLPSLEHDLTLAVDRDAAHTFLDVVTIGYAANLFPDTGARRHLSIRKVSDGTAIYRKVTSASNNLNGSESLHLDTSLGQAVTVAQWQVGFLRLCRLEDDVNAINYEARSYATCRLRVRELPHEAPL